MRRVRRQRGLSALRREDVRGLQGLLQAHRAEELQVRVPRRQELPGGQATPQPLSILSLPEVPRRRHGQRGRAHQRPQGPTRPLAHQAQESQLNAVRHGHSATHRHRRHRHLASSIDNTFVIAFVNSSSGSSSICFGRRHTAATAAAAFERFRCTTRATFQRLDAESDVSRLQQGRRKRQSCFFVLNCINMITFFF